MTFTPTRREFVKIGAMAGAGMLLARNMAWAFYNTQPGTIPLFGTTLRGIGQIPVAAPDGIAPVTGVTHYTMNVKQFADPGVCALGPTTLRGYHPANSLVPGVSAQAHLGGIIVAQRGTPIQITFRNQLEGTHPIPIDTSIEGTLGPQDNRIAVHLHGGLVPWISDGGPFDWFDEFGNTGLSFLNDVLTVGASPGSADYYYPNDQSARLMWYHDHAHGTTRLNAYAGIASAYILRDAKEAAMIGLLPQYIEAGGTAEIPLIIQDKTFVGADISAIDPTWTGPTGAGSLWYPHVYEKTRWKLGGKGLPLPPISCVPEAFGDTMLVNGTAYPKAPIEPKVYRFRLLNACNARVVNLQMYVDDGSQNGVTIDPVTLAPTNAKGPDFVVIGTEGGFLPQAAIVPANVPFNPITFGGSLVTAPGERWDLIVDFSAFAGQNIVLYNDAPAPYPFGDPRYDYFPGAPGNPAVSPTGYGPNTRVLMRFDVSPTIPANTLGDLAFKAEFDAVLDKGIDPFHGDVSLATVPKNFANPNRGKNPYGATVARMLTLNEAFDGYGRLIQFLGTNVPGPTGGFGRAYIDPATEVIAAGTTEIWQIANLTGDTHPIHFHLANAMVVARQPFKVQGFNGVPVYLALPRPAEPQEQGWKETVRMHPGEVTTVVMKFDLGAAIQRAGGGTVATPSSPRTTGHEFVWHCHILEHEEHDMMRPLVVI